MEAYRHLGAAELTAYMERLLRAAGASEAHARLTAESLAAASLRGVDSHGAQLLTFYLEQLIDGRVDGRGAGRVERESGACLLYDGENALGQVVAGACAEHAARLASAFGVGLAVARDSNHFGAAAFWAERIAARGHVGIVMCNASPMVAPWQAREAVWGTNPICCALPGGAAWELDMATTTVAMGKIYKANVNREPEIPPGWAMDSTGAPTVSTAAALSGFLMPLGGYKGSGLAMMVEILTGALSGGAIGRELGGLRNKTKPFGVSQFFLAIDPERFGGRERFVRRVGELVEMVKSRAVAQGFEEVLVAGDPEWRVERERRERGIPVTEGLWTDLAGLAARLGVEAPR